MVNIQKDIVDWLKTLKGWQTELAYRILTKKIEESDISEMVTMVKSNHIFVDKAFPNFVNSANEKRIRLLSIESIQNIESLAPRNPLKFEKDKNLIVIYGSNGSGKSGYTKIIKKISGKPHSKNLKPNVFNPNTANGKCVIKYSINGAEPPIEQEWIINDNPISDLRRIDVFDTTTGNGYVDEANAVAHTPRCVALFRTLSRCYSKVQEKLEQEKSKLAKIIPSIPNEYQTTASARIYNGLNKNSTEPTLASVLLWNEENEIAKLELEKRLKEKDPAKSAIEKRKQKLEIDKIVKEITDAYLQINLDAIKAINALKNDANSKRKIVQDSAQIIARKSELQGIGSQVWKSLWEAARAFSLQEAYKKIEYPNVGDDARCVLCHQPLNSDAKERLSSFDSFIKSQLENEATQAERVYADKLEKLPIAINQDILSSKCNAANLIDEWLERLVAIWQQIENASNSIKQNTDVSIDIKFIMNYIEMLKAISTQYENEAIQLDADAKQFDRNRAEKELLELNAKKWCSEQKEHILKEIERLKKVAAYDDQISQCNTRSITTKASAISETVITEEYVKRFNNELSILNANKISVELVKERAAKGAITHSLKLKGIDEYKPADILSEGEHRIIALASFLADVTGDNNSNPFVFDDPISSLDQQYEEKTVERLVELSNTRQVVVFTHRLSLLGLLNEKCDSNNIQIVGIRAENWGTGEIGDTPLFAKKTKEALNNIKNERISKAKKIFKDSGSEAYYPYGKSLCSDIRIIVERIVELDFLADVIQRYRRAVNTMNKIDKLAKITKADCDLINDFMTRYSCYEHSQPTETPVEIPEPSEIEKDVDGLIAWLSEFNKRD
jgi:energy-coupling factor transporter ATP-binding protein EcfA2